MAETMLNHRTYTLKLQRIQICDLALALALLGDKAPKWQKLHDEVKRQLREQDEKEEKA